MWKRNGNSGTGTGKIRANIRQINRSPNYNAVHCAGKRVERAALGLPASWATISSWLEERATAVPVADEAGHPAAWKCPEIPVLPNYDTVPEPGFWKVFPFFSPKRVPQNKIDVDRLAEWVHDCQSKWDRRKRKVAKRAIKNLREGARTLLKKNLPPLRSRNAQSAIVHGRAVTDTIASWVKSGVVAGPFKTVPLENFRSNPLMAVPQKNKVRLVMNLSAPAGSAFNEAIKPESVKKLDMSSAKKAGEKSLKTGRFAEIAKLDMKDAYKLIPGHPEQWNHYGFNWLG